MLLFYSDCFISRPLWWCVCLNFAALVIVHPEVKNWIKYARFEEKHGYIAHGRKVYERAVEFFGEEHVDENLFVAFARFEETQKEASAAQTSQTSFWLSFCWRSYCVMYLFTFVLYLCSSSESGWSISTLWTESLNIRHRSSSKTTPCLRRSLETAEESRMSSSASEGSSTKRKLRYQF